MHPRSVALASGRRDGSLPAKPKLQGGRQETGRPDKPAGRPSQPGRVSGFESEWACKLAAQAPVRVDKTDTHVNCLDSIAP